jgi:outer membrane protein assembly factor BamD
MNVRIATACLTGLALLCACATAPRQEQQSVKPDEQSYNKAMEFFNSGNYFDSIPAFTALREKFPLSPYAVLAELRLGESHYKKGEYIEAVHFFKNFRRLHPSNQYVPYSIFMTGMCYYKQILEPDRDQTFARDAIEHFRLLIDQYPDNPYTGQALCKMSEALKQLARHEFFVAQYYLGMGDYTAARKRLRDIFKQYPHSLPQAKLLYYYAKAALLSQEHDRGMKVLRLLGQKYPSSPYTPKAQKLLKNPGSVSIEEQSSE